MEIVTEWVANIILFILIATILDMLLPSSGMQKYVKLVTGLLLIVIILTPLLKFVTQDFEKSFASMKLGPNHEEKNIENLIEMKKTEIQASSRAYILEQMAVQMKAEVEEELVQKYGVKVVNVLPLIEDSKEIVDEADIVDLLQSIEVEITETDEVSPPTNRESNTAVEAVKPVIIDTSKEITKLNQDFDLSGIKALLGARWGVDPEMVVVTLEGGRR